MQRGGGFPKLFTIFPPMTDNNLGLLTKLALTSIFFIGCATAKFDINKVEVSTEKTPQNILRLKYHNHSNVEYEHAEKIIKNVLAPGDDFWGYYHIQYDINKREEGIFLFDLGLTGLIDGVIVFSLNLIGVPKAKVHHNLKATVYLFDSNGNIVGTYEESSSIMKYKGLYYGYNAPIKEITDKFRTMFKEIINSIDLDNKRVNNLLELSGTLKEDKSAEIYTEVYRLMK